MPKLGVKWMATDEGVLGRSTGVFFRATVTAAAPASSGTAYDIHHYENAQAEMHMVFRDHTIPT